MRSRREKSESECPRLPAASGRTPLIVATEGFALTGAPQHETQICTPKCHDNRQQAFTITPRIETAVPFLCRCRCEAIGWSSQAKDGIAKSYTVPPGIITVIIQKTTKTAM
eukprot:1526939-Amphidinium_carterae.1